MKLSVLVLGPGSAVHVIHPSAYCRDHQRTRPDGSPSSADSGRNDERETYRLASKSSSRGSVCWSAATIEVPVLMRKSLHTLALRYFGRCGFGAIEPRKNGPDEFSNPHFSRRYRTLHTLKGRERRTQSRREPPDFDPDRPRDAAPRDEPPADETAAVDERACSTDVVLACDSACPSVSVRCRGESKSSARWIVPTFTMSRCSCRASRSTFAPIFAELGTSTTRAPRRKDSCTRCSR